LIPISYWYQFRHGLNTIGSFKNSSKVTLTLYVTTEILMEYEEIITLKYHPKVATEVLRTLLKLPNVFRQFIYVSLALN